MIQEPTMTIRKRLSNALRRFTANQNGNVGIIFALAAVPVVMAAGAAIDFGRFSAAQTHLQASLDAGALGGATALDVKAADREKYAADLFLADMAEGPGGGLPVSYSFKVVDKSLVATASLDVPMSFMSVAGISKLTAVGNNEVGIGEGKKAEIALVLDYSGSMEDSIKGQVKYVAMKNAANKLVNELSIAQPKNVKFGLVPFSHHVYTTMPGAYVVGQTGVWTGCTQDRQYPFNLSDSTPIAADPSKFGQAQATEHTDWGCKGYKNDGNGYAKHGLVTRGLTDDFPSITNQLNSMTPYAWTHIAVGVEFGYHLLSPNEPFSEGKSYADKSTEKFMVVLTDGVQTEPGFGPAGTRTVSQGESNLEKLCSGAKSNGIHIVTMAFDIDDGATRQRLKNCATDPAVDFFVLSDTADLAHAFDSVKAAITAQVFLSK
jgi:Flp pilus assembly protein TadG